MDFILGVSNYKVKKEKVEIFVLWLPLFLFVGGKSYPEGPTSRSWVGKDN